MREQALLNLDWLLDLFATNVERFGGRVHWAATAVEAASCVARIAAADGVRVVVKSKSMLSEEIGLNRLLQAGGLEVVETDLGEYIIQLAGEAPFHITGPAIHKSIDEIRHLFAAEAGEGISEDPEALMAFARSRLRSKFLSAELGVTGCNFGVASTGSVVLISNEGNARCVTTFPRTHVVLMGIERVVPDWESLDPLLTVLPRASTGASATSYVTAITGARRAGELDGPKELHVVIVDNGRSRLLGSEFHKILSCIRCGACLDYCPVYRHVGGHAYRSTYSGPIGVALTPLLFGLEESARIVDYCTLCGACDEICPARIPLAHYILRLRQEAVRLGLRGATCGAAMRAFAAATEHPTAFSAGRCVFRSKPNTDSAPSRTLIPLQVEHRFRSKPNTDSAGKPNTFRALQRNH